MELLVVDDDLDVRQIVQRALNRQGVRISTAATGAEAVAHAMRSPIDLVVLDLHLPDMTGLEVLEELRAVHPSMYVIMLTGAGSEADRVLGLVSGADDYMVKPFSPRELAARVLAVSRRFTEPGTDEPVDVPTASRSSYQVTPSMAPFQPPARSRAPDSLEATGVIAGTVIRYASDAMVALVGAASIDDVVGHDVFEFVAAQSIGATRARHEQARAGHWPRPELLTVNRVDGVEVLVEIASAPVLWEGRA